MADTLILKDEKNRVEKRRKLAATSLVTEEVAGKLLDHDFFRALLIRASQIEPLSIQKGTKFPGNVKDRFESAR